MATYSGKVTGGTLKLRSSASTSSTQLATIPDATSLSVTTIPNDQEWFSTTYQSTSGYVMARWIAITSGGKAGVVSTTSGSLNIRARPSTDASVSFTLAKGASLRILESITGWYRIGCSSGTGWASSDYVKEDSSGGGDSGDTETTVGHYVQVSSAYNSVNVRADTKTSSTLRGVLLSGTKVYCSAVPSSTWVQIIWGGTGSSTAYIMSQYLVDGGSAPSSRRSRAIAIANSMAGKGYPYQGKIGNLGLTAEDWCVQYLSWLMKASGCTSYPDFSSQANVSGAISFFGSKFGLVANGRTPNLGDWVMYSSGTERFAHVGLIVAKNGDNITTVEGNLGKTIKKVGPYDYHNGVNKFTVYGFATPSW